MKVLRRCVEFLLQPSQAPLPGAKAVEEEEERKKTETMASPCCHSPCLGLAEPPEPRHRMASISVTSARAARSHFAKSSTSSLLPNSRFTNHESLPTMEEAFSNFSEAFPQFLETHEADSIREKEYPHLSDHVCLDYNGVGLFSHFQMSLSPPCFSISYKAASLKTEMQNGEQDSGFESSIRKRIMNFMKISSDEYGMVSTVNRTAAFRLLAETYPFQSNRNLLTVYDYESEAITAMVESSLKRGARVKSACFSWPGMRIQSAKLKKLLSTKKKKKNKRGLLVFPHMSRMTGVRYPYLWMKFAQENGWQVALDACSLGPKDMDTLGITLIQPDFIICSFFKVFGENPSGFAGLFIKKSSREALETSLMARSLGIVSIIRAGRLSQLPEDEMDTTSSFSGPVPKFEKGETSKAAEDKKEEEEEEKEERKEEAEEEEEGKGEEEKGDPSSEIIEIEDETVIDFYGLEHADSLGLLLIYSRLRCIINWLVIALMKLNHPNSENGRSLVKIYGPRVKFDRGPALAFNVFDWKGEKINPSLVQKLADRSNISLSCGFLQNIVFSEKHDAIPPVTEKAEGNDRGIAVVNASFGFLADFRDAYRLWAFVAKFLDADFVEKERWRYLALNQKMVEV